MNTTKHENHEQRLIKRLAGIVADDWEIWEWDAIHYDLPDDGTEKVKYRGSRCRRNTDGRRVPFGPITEVTLTKQERAAEYARFESETGDCHLCLGERMVWLGWSAEHGHRHGVCSRCCGTGKAP